MSKLQTQSFEGEVSMYEYVKDDSGWFEKITKFLYFCDMGESVPKDLHFSGGFSWRVLLTFAWNLLQDKDG